MKKTILTVFSLLLITVGVTKAATIKKADVSAEYITSLDVDLLCKAIIKGDIETVHKLIEFGEDLNKKSLGKTPLIYAARYNRVEILQLLLANGANLKTKCDKGRNALDYAELSNAKEAMAVLEKAMLDAKKAKKARKKRK